MGKFISGETGRTGFLVLGPLNSLLHSKGSQKEYSLLSQLVVLVIALYLILVRLFRFQRAQRNIEYVRSHRPLTPATAQPVVHTLAQIEFPMMYQKSLEFALFRTYGIPTISELLQKTSLFSTPSTAGRRYADTKVLISEFLGRKWASPDFIAAMARLNAIHGHYRDQGKISESDMLYTLILFAQQTSKWIDRFDWRQMTHEERDALGTFWQGIGEMMEIDYDNLGLRGWEEHPNLPISANGRGRGTWKDGADWILAVDEWAERYEHRYMVPAASNAVVAEQTIELLLYEVPRFLHPIGRQVVSALMDNRLRKSMLVQPPPTWVHCTIMTILLARRFIIKWLMPPRPEFLKVSVITELDEKTSEGKHHLLEYDNYPYYVAPTWANRWGLRAWLRWVSGLPLPGDKKMDPQGYDPLKVGAGVGKGAAEQERRQYKVEEVLAGRGCPLAFSK